MRSTYLLTALLLFTTSCKDGNSVYDEDYEPDNPDPVINTILPEQGYLAGVDSVIIQGQNFSSDPDELTVNFGGSPGIIKSASPTELVVRPGTISGDEILVRVSARGAIHFNDPFYYKLEDPFNFYFGTNGDYKPTTPPAVDGDDNIYTITNNNGLIRYTRISPDGIITYDNVKYPGEPRPNPNNTSPFPIDSTMRFTQYSSLLISPTGEMFMTQQGIRAIFRKTFGDDVREQVWSASSSGGLQIRGMVIDDKNNLWVVGQGSNEIHRFNLNSRAETKFPFAGDISSVAYYNDQLFVGGIINGKREVWKFDMDASGNISNPELYFDYASNYSSGQLSDMIFTDQGELLIMNNGPEGIIRVFPDGTHQAMYEGMLTSQIFGITWRSDKYAAVTARGDNGGVYFLNGYDRKRAGIFGFN